jgi:hypothetical protein
MPKPIFVKTHLNILTEFLQLFTITEVPLQLNSKINTSNSIPICPVDLYVIYPTQFGLRRLFSQDFGPLSSSSPQHPSLTPPQSNHTNVSSSDDENDDYNENNLSDDNDDNNDDEKYDQTGELYTSPSIPNKTIPTYTLPVLYLFIPRDMNWAPSTSTPMTYFIPFLNNSSIFQAQNALIHPGGSITCRCYDCIYYNYRNDHKFYNNSYNDYDNGPFTNIGCLVRLLSSHITGPSQWPITITPSKLVQADGDEQNDQNDKTCQKASQNCDINKVNSGIIIGSNDNNDDNNDNKFDSEGIGNDGNDDDNCVGSDDDDSDIPAIHDELLSVTNNGHINTNFNSTPIDINDINDKPYYINEYLDYFQFIAQKSRYCCKKIQYIMGEFDRTDLTKLVISVTHPPGVEFKSGTSIPFCIRERE